MLRNRMLVCVTALGLATIAPAITPEVAHACGGCFTPPNPTGTPTPVTAHRMAVALSPTETTLWDQIEYAGAPEDFVWVLPIAGTSTVEIADNGFFESLQANTQIFLEGPPPPRTSCSDPCTAFGFGGFASGSASPRSASESGGMPDVEVHHEGVVGPYETATIGAADPDALVAWLREHDYQVPDALLPIIRHYVALEMNFVVLRLRPSLNVQRMQPVRITVPGLQTSFPLRMVAAGIDDHVALELFVLAESRIEAANFGNAEVDRAAITYDWASSTFDYDARFEDALFAGEGVETNWVAEFAGAADHNIGFYESFDAVTGEMHSAREDWAVATRSLPEAYLTRLRTDLPVSELDEDLGLQMSDGGDLGTFIRVTREANRAPEPDCPTYCAVSDGTTGPGGSAVRGAGASRCSAGFGARGASG
ncbi:MAG: DUF2330 domain-containing protein, partial [Myxococcota bacterium]|nr:DUF2330 domain-containing protein [Myxococcota bacterium]